jgi:hypothetical protein
MMNYLIAIISGFVAGCILKNKIVSLLLQARNWVVNKLTGL